MIGISYINKCKSAINNSYCSNIDAFSIMLFVVINTQLPLSSIVVIINNCNDNNHNIFIYILLIFHMCTFDIVSCCSFDYLQEINSDIPA